MKPILADDYNSGEFRVNQIYYKYFFFFKPPYWLVHRNVNNFWFGLE